MNPIRHPPAAAVRLALPERLDALTAMAVYDHYRQFIDSGACCLTLDAGAMAYISSKGIRSLLRLRRACHAAGGSLCLENLQSFAREVLAASGLNADLDRQDGERGPVCRP
ncbi:MAG: STAS domain-containing protein [Desulfosarcinaceae bacterium]|nr:STAS domain-containing protein [Desulfosarcinaceae bacterium]